MEKLYTSYREDFQILLDDCLDICSQIQKYSKKVIVRDIYDRRRSARRDIFKDPRKAVQKVKNFGWTLCQDSLLKLPDLIGLTVVLSYGDFVELFAEELKNLCSNKKIVVRDLNRIKARNGYYAYHVLTSRVVGGDSLFCEIQIKTMLHDAWSSKMHDLTYKPSGSLDPRVEALMSSIADTLESLEAQSQLIRDIIVSGWDVEREAREIARRELFKQVINALSEEFAGGDVAPELELFKQIESEKQRLAECNKDDKLLDGFVSAARELCEDIQTLRYGWILMALLSSIRPLGELNRALETAIDKWVLSLDNYQGDVTSSEITALPFVFYALGDLDRSIEIAKQLLAHESSKIGQPARVDLRANVVAFEIERAYHHPLRDKKQHFELGKRLKMELIELNLLSGLQDQEGALEDSKGMHKIAFAETLEEVRDGIQICQRSCNMRTTDTLLVVEAYEELNVRLGWRRYFELEAAIQHRSVSANFQKP